MQRDDAPQVKPQPQDGNPVAADPAPGFIPLSEMQQEIAMSMETDAAGSIIRFPLTGFDMRIATEMFCLLRLEYLPSETATEPSGVQLLLTQSQAEALALSLLKFAGKVGEPMDSWPS